MSIKKINKNNVVFALIKLHFIHIFYLFSKITLLSCQVTHCDVCQKMNRKLSAARPELHPISVKTPWYHLGIDFVGPISPSLPIGKRYILTISDYCTKWAEVIATTNKTASETALALFRVGIIYYHIFTLLIN